MREENGTTVEKKREKVCERTRTFSKSRVLIDNQNQYCGQNPVVVLTGKGDSLLWLFKILRRCKIEFLPLFFPARTTSLTLKTLLSRHTAMQEEKVTAKNRAKAHKKKQEERENFRSRRIVVFKKCRSKLATKIEISVNRTRTTMASPVALAFKIVGEISS